MPGEPTPDIHLLGQTGAIALNSMENFEGKVYQLFNHNSYNSFELAKKMLTQNTYICGTLRSDRKSNPKEVRKAKLKKEEFLGRNYSEAFVIFLFCLPVMYQKLQVTFTLSAVPKILLKTYLIGI